MTRLQVGDTVTYANSPGFAELVGAEVAHMVATGQVDLATAVRELRKSRHPALRSIADWIETRPVSAMLLATVLNVCAGLLGPQLVSGDDPSVVPSQGYSEEHVDRIIKSILEHYDREQPEVSDPAPLRRGRDEVRPGRESDAVDPGERPERQ